MKMERIGEGGRVWERRNRPSSVVTNVGEKEEEEELMRSKSSPSLQLSFNNLWPRASGPVER